MFARHGQPPDVQHQAVASAWTAALAASRLPFPDGRPRLAFAMPLPAGMDVEADAMDLELAGRVPVATVRAELLATMPEGIELVDLHDVWPGEPPLAAQARRAEYAVTMRTKASPAALREAAMRLLAAESLPRDRPKAGRSVPYDLRPLLVDVALEDFGPSEDAGPPVARMRILVALNPALGAGRPDEVVAALRDAIAESIRDAAANAAPDTVEPPEIAVEAVDRRRIVLDSDLRGESGSTG